MKNFTLTLVLLSTVTVLGGCSKKIVLRDPVTGHTMRCVQEKTDLMASMGLAQGAEDCAVFHEKLGFRRVK